MTSVRDSSPHRHALSPMPNVQYLVCSFCQGPSSRPLRHKLAPYLTDPSCRIRQADLDWLDKWRLLMPSHVEWDLPFIQDREFQDEYHSELPKRNVASKVMWVPSIEGKISSEWDDLDAWRTIVFYSRHSQKEQLYPQFEHLWEQTTATEPHNNISKRALHPYNDDIQCTKLPFHSACLRILYEACNEVDGPGGRATSTVSDVVEKILLPSWREGDVNMDWCSCHEFNTRYGTERTRLLRPWADLWDPMNPDTNVLGSLGMC